MVFKKLIIPCLVIFFVLMLAKILPPTFSYPDRVLGLVFNVFDTGEVLYGNKFNDAVHKVIPSIATVQSFIGGRLLKSGNGLVLTQDGLIVTLNSLVPTEADFYQISIDGKLNQGRVVRRNYSSNLVIMDIGEGGFLPANFFTDSADTAGDLFIISQHRDLDSFKVRVKNFSFSDTRKASSEGIVVDQNGLVLGFANIDNESAKIISSYDIEQFFLKYYSVEVE